MKKLLEFIHTANNNVLGINRRNLDYVYSLNPRKNFKLADDKYLAKKILAEHKIAVPETYAVIEYSWEIDQYLEKLSRHESIVVKPSMGSGGNGILILDRREGAWYTPKGKEYTNEKLKFHISAIIFGAYSFDKTDKCIVEEKLIPHNAFQKIYSIGVPDLRILMIENAPVMAMLRVPTNESGGKANLHQGAIGIGVDMENGVLTEGFFRNKPTGVHPDSSFKFTGLTIPFWNEIIGICEECASIVPLKYLGIDVIIDQLKGPQIIEINARPGLQIQNANGLGLLKKLRMIG